MIAALVAEATATQKDKELVVELVLRIVLPMELKKAAKLVGLRDYRSAGS